MRNVIITGAAGNLGKATTEKFLLEGYKVFAVDSKGLSLQGDRGGKGEVEMIHIDLTNENETTEAIGKMASGNNLDAALLLVGGFAMGGINETDQQALKKMYTLNFETAFFAVRPIFQKMMTQLGGGRIIFVGARPALLPADGKNTLAYALSKSLIFKLAEFLNAEAAGKNVVVHVIVPGIIDTSANRAAMPSANFSSWVKPETIAETIFQLCSEKESAIRDTVVKLYGNS